MIKMIDLGSFFVGILLLVMSVASWVLFYLGRKKAIRIKDEGDNSFAAVLAVLITGNWKFSNSLFNVCVYISRCLTEREKNVIINIIKGKK